MSEEPGGAPPEASGPEAGEVGEGGEGAAADIEHTAVKIDEIARRISRKQSMYQARQGEEDEILDVDRTALEAILDVSARLKDIQKKSKISMSTLALAHESYKDKQVNKIP